MKKRSGIFFFMCLLFFLNTKEGVTKTHHYGSCYLEGEHITGVLQDEQGLIWIGTHRGLFSFNGYDFQNYNKENEPALSNKHITSLYRATGSGIQVFFLDETSITIHKNGRISPCTHYKNTIAQAITVNSLLDKIPYLSFIDANTNNWYLSSGRMIKNGKLISVKGLQDFLDQHKEGLLFNCHFLGEDGVIWIGTNKGLLKVAGEPSLQGNSPMLLTNAKQYDLASKKWVQTKITKGGEINSPSGSIHLDVALANYHDSSSNSFEYRIVGQDTEWTNNGTGNSIIYNNLSPGEYQLEVRGKPKNGKWSSVPLSFLINVPYSLYQTMIFWLLTISLSSIIFYLLYQLYSIWGHSPSLFKKSINEEINDRIEGDLARMGMEIELLKIKAYSKEQKKVIMRIVSNSSRKVISTIGDLLWMIDARKDYIKHLLDRIKEQANETLGWQGVQTSFEFNVYNQDSSITFPFKKHLFFFCKSTLETIAMNPKVRYVKIYLDETPLQFRLSFVLDEGMRFGSESLKTMERESKSLKGLLSFPSTDEVKLIIPKQLSNINSMVSKLMPKL